MDTIKLVILAVSAVFLLIGLIVTFKGQLYLLKKIRRWNPIKAFVSLMPPFLLLYLKFDTQVRIICKRFPAHTTYFKTGLLIIFLGTTFLLITEYLL
jgi:hypothetical protein